MHRKPSTRYAIGRDRIVSAGSVNEVKRLVERNLCRPFGPAEPSDFWGIVAQEWDLFTLTGRSPRFEPFSREWSIPSQNLRPGHFIPFRVFTQPTNSKKLGPWFKIYGLIGLSDIWLWARLWFYDSEFPKVVLGVDRKQENIFLREPICF